MHDSAKTNAGNLVEVGLKRVVAKVNSAELLISNEATLQHHLALEIHLAALERKTGIEMTLEKRVFIEDGALPKGQNKADIDIIFACNSEEKRCAIELKFFKRGNQREPNNRYDAYADIARLEIYKSKNICDFGYFILMTDHPHYYDPSFGAHSHATGDFTLRNGAKYESGQVLTYDTATPYGTPLTLKNNYTFDWGNWDNDLKLLVVNV